MEPYESVCCTSVKSATRANPNRVTKCCNEAAFAIGCWLHLHHLPGFLGARFSPVRPLRFALEYDEGEKTPSLLLATFVVCGTVLHRRDRAVLGAEYATRRNPRAFM
jgi:hypothetical protein